MKVVPADAKAFSGISAVVATANDGLWVGEDRGVINISAQEIQKLETNSSYRVSSRLFGLLDGLSSQLQPVFPGPSAIQTSDGLIWFATSNGVVWTDPKRIRENTIKPGVLISPITLNGKLYYPDASDDLQLPAHTTSLQIGYTATSLSIPERVRFRYRLEGAGTPWEDAGTRRRCWSATSVPAIIDSG